MRFYINSLIFLSVILIPCQVFAAKDPVTWTLTPGTGFPVTHVGDQSRVKYTLTNQLPFSTKIIVTEKVTGGNFTVRDECKNLAIASGGHCDVYVGFNPAAGGDSTFQLIFGYGNNRVPAAQLTAVGTGDSPDVKLSGSVRGLPSAFYQNDTPDFSAEFINKGSVELTSCSTGGSAIVLTGDAASTATVGSLVDGCNGQNIDVGKPCYITGKIINTSTTGSLNLTAHLSCTANSGSVESNPKAASFVESSTGCTVHGYVTLPLPANTFVYAENDVQFQFENECGTVTPLSTDVSVSGINANVVVSSSLSTCGSTLAAFSHCVVTASVTPLETGNMTVTGAAFTGGNAAHAVTAASVSQPGYHHNVTFINQCPFNVWYGIANDGPNKEDPTSPSTPNDYLLPVQNSGGRPATKTVQFPGEYLGGFWGRTQCVANQTNNTFVCQTADCPTTGYNSGKCNGTEPLEPFSRLEMNFFDQPLTDGSFDGVYDVSLIGGFNIPVEMKGFGPTQSVELPPPYNNSAFQCNGAGASIQPPSTTLGNCPWTFAIPGGSNRMPTKAFYFVTNESAPPTYDLSANDNCGCPSGTLCGLTMGHGGADNNRYFPACGEFLGYMTVNSLCGAVYDMGSYTGPAPSTFFHCANNLNTQLGKPGRYLPDNTVGDLYSCTFNSAFPAYLNSCFLADDAAGHTDKCCGAKNWSFTAQDFFANISNPDWLSPSSHLVPSPLTSIEWLTNACPTAYSYPFGDHFGSFYCKKSTTTTNVKMDYQVVFCPGGVTGTPEI